MLLNELLSLDAEHIVNQTSSRVSCPSVPFFSPSHSLVRLSHLQHNPRLCFFNFQSIPNILHSGQQRKEVCFFWKYGHSLSRIFLPIFRKTLKNQGTGGSLRDLLQPFFIPLKKLQGPYGPLKGQNMVKLALKESEIFKNCLFSRGARSPSLVDLA